MPASRKKRQGQERKARSGRQLVRWNGGECRHGCPKPPLPTGHIASKFVNAFLDKNNKNACEGLTFAYKKAPGALNHEANRKLLIDYFVANGIEMLIDSDSYPTWQSSAASMAGAILAFENYDASKDLMAVMVDLFRENPDRLKNQDLAEGCERSLTRFFMKRTSCSCLDAKYAVVKTQPKTGICRHCKLRKERCSLFVCSCCERRQYCSQECFEKAWPRHKSFCKAYRKQKQENETEDIKSLKERLEALKSLPEPQDAPTLRELRERLERLKTTGTF